MKLVTYSRIDSISVGILAGDGLIDIPSVWPGPNPPRSVKEILTRGPDCLAKFAELAKAAQALMPLDSVKLLAPIPRPGKVIALAGNYSEHIREAGLALGPGQLETGRVVHARRPYQGRSLCHRQS